MYYAFLCVCVCVPQAFDDYSLTRMAVDKDNKPVLELCLQNGGNVNEICDEYGTLLHTLFQSDRSPDENKAFEILVFLLQCGKSIFNANKSNVSYESRHLEIFGCLTY